MNAACFRALFEPVVRVGLNWDAVAQREGIEVREIVVNHATDFRGWFFPWYVDTHGARTEYATPGARPLEVVEALDDITALLPGIADVAAGMHSHYRLRPLLFAAYELGNGRRLLLDGNHSLAALLRERVAFGALVLSLDGPCDAALLPDLEHWQN